MKPIILLSSNKETWFLFFRNSKDAIQDYYGAIADYTKAIEINPNDGDAYYNRGASKGDIEDYYGAIADFTKAIDINPNDNGSYWNRSIAKERIGDIEGACADAKKSVSLGDATTDNQRWIRNNC